MAKKEDNNSWGANPITITTVILFITLLFSAYTYFEQNIGDIYPSISNTNGQPRKTCPANLVVQNFDKTQSEDVSQLIVNYGTIVSVKVYGEGEGVIIEPKESIIALPKDQGYDFPINVTLNISEPRPSTINFSIFAECFKTNCKNNKIEVLTCDYIRNESAENKYNTGPYYQLVTHN